MSGNVPPIPLPLGTNIGNPTSLNRTNPIPVDTTNNTTTTNVVQNDDSDSDVEEDTRSSSEFLDDLNAEFHDRALLSNTIMSFYNDGMVGVA
ncbi:hypothetical protein Tco_1123660 [Tanacetum coccineum]|uniref:Uncharacterized protein n=1 Tax=Tanacetum coccineum TaxID=301880 RepID=A0ABQ5J3Z4_9ASTR